MNIVVCDDIDGTFQRSGELARLDEGTLRVYDTVAETRAALSERLRDAQVAVAIRDRLWPRGSECSAAAPAYCGDRRASPY